MAGIYIHIPFCKSKCTYCDFTSFAGALGKADAYFACLYREIKGRALTLKDKVFDTVYIGGGTPSFVDQKYILGALRQVKNTLNVTPDAEITIEMNPGTVNEEKIKCYEKAGINRFSIGLQSADDKMLKRLNRIHGTKEYLYALELLKGQNISADVMIGLFDQTKEDVKNSIDLALSSKDVKHISMYALKAEEGTPMFGAYLNGDLPSDDEVAELYDFGVEYLKSKGLNRYEVSNFAVEGYESKHNLNYWKRGEYIGFGVGASSFINERRFTNTEDIDEYVRCILTNHVAEVFSEDIEGDERKFEYVMLNLRTTFGIKLDEYKKVFDSEFLVDFKDKLSTVRKYLDINDERVKIKDEYLYVQNNIIINLMD